MQEDENDGISLREWKLQGLGSLDDPDDEVEEDAPLSLSASLGQLVGKSKFSDVVFLVGPDSREVPAHRMFLATRSPVFEAMLYPSDGDAAEMKAGVSGGARMEIKVPDCSPHAFVTMLRCIYSGNAGEIDAESLVELLYVAKKCAPKRTTANCPAVVDLNAVNADSVDSLKAACNDFLSSGVNVQNACLLFNNEVAHTCRCKWVTRLLLRCSLQSLDQKDDVLKFIEEHFDIIINTEGFLNLTEKSLNAILDSNKLFVSEVNTRRACAKLLTRARPPENRSICSSPSSSGCELSCSARAKLTRIDTSSAWARASVFTMCHHCWRAEPRCRRCCRAFASRSCRWRRSLRRCIPAC